MVAVPRGWEPLLPRHDAGWPVSAQSCSCSGIVRAMRTALVAAAVHPSRESPSLACAPQVVPSIAIAFVTYEQLKELMGVEIRISE